ncbi:Putative ligase protein [Collimonas arenae]|uniref:Putative ligase protein n=1 Tax=Collimonas arenae TaxID=279058 RepID=A0A0A1F672_9BURK|nr:2'-5' RNA ligase family protein [Collimonas arenae]AIY39189.1 Putative ligase protein [Collimonas arenae]
MPHDKPLPGVASPPQPTDRIFFAIVPDTAVAARVEKLAENLRQQHDLHGSLIDVEHLHITVLFVGNYVGYPQDTVNAASWAASHVIQAPFRVQLNHVLTFANKSGVVRRYPTVLCGDEGVLGVETLHRNLSDALHRCGFMRRPSTMTPHMTLLYDREKIVAQAVPPIEFDVGEFVLLNRHIGQRRQYTVLGRWPLHDQSSR